MAPEESRDGRTPPLQAIVGLGKRGERYAQALSAFVRCDLRTLSPDVETDFLALLKRPELSGVILTVPAACAEAMAQAALQAGKSVLVDDPSALTPNAVAVLTAEAKRRGLALQLGGLAAFAPARRALLAAAKAGAIGRLCWLRAERLGALTGGALDLLDLALALALADDEPAQIKVSAAAINRCDQTDLGETWLTFEAGFRASLLASPTAHLARESVLLVGETGTLCLEAGALSLHRDGEVSSVVLPEEDAASAALAAFARASSLEPLSRTLLAAQRALDEDRPMKPAEPLPKDVFVHPTAVVEGEIHLGAGTKVWHFSKLLGPLTIGEACSLGQNVVVERHVTLGRNVKIQNNVSVYSGVVLEDDVFCGPSMVFTNVGTPRSHYPRRGAYLETRVKRGASIGANATVVCGHTLGQYCFVGAGAVVTRDVPDYALVYGNPARVKGFACYCGVSLPFNVDEGSEQGACPECHRAYAREGLRVWETTP